MAKSLVKHIVEGRKILKRKQRQGSIIDIKLIQYTFVYSNMQGTRHFVRISVCLNAVEFLLFLTHSNLLEFLLGK